MSENQKMTVAEAEDTALYLRNVADYLERLAGRVRGGGIPITGSVTFIEFPWGAVTVKP